jgi:hypothetical protein
MLILSAFKRANQNNMSGLQYFGIAADLSKFEMLNGFDKKIDVFRNLTCHEL